MATSGAAGTLEPLFCCKIWGNNIGVIKGLYRVYLGVEYRGYIGMVEKKMETTIMGFIRIIGYI